MVAHRQSTIEYVDDDGRPVPIARNGRLVVVTLVAMVVLVVAVGGGVVLQLSRAVQNIIAWAIAVSSQLSTRGRVTSQTATTFLVLGDDLLSPGPPTGTDSAAGVKRGSARGEPIMLASVAASRMGGALDSILYDRWVTIPADSQIKINAAHAFRRLSLLTQATAQLTGVDLTHSAAVGRGAQVQGAQTTNNGGLSFHQGTNHLASTEASAYARQRGPPNRHHDRAYCQENAVRVWLSRASSSGAPSDPIETHRLLVP